MSHLSLPPPHSPTSSQVDRHHLLPLLFPAVLDCDCVNAWSCNCASWFRPCVWLTIYQDRWVHAFLATPSWRSEVHWIGRWRRDEPPSRGPCSGLCGRLTSHGRRCGSCWKGSTPSPTTNLPWTYDYNLAIGDNLKRCTKKCKGKEGEELPKEIDIFGQWNGDWFHFHHNIMSKRELVPILRQSLLLCRDPLQRFLLLQAPNNVFSLPLFHSVVG